MSFGDRPKIETGLGFFSPFPFGSGFLKARETEPGPGSESRTLHPLRPPLMRNSRGSLILIKKIFKFAIFVDLQYNWES